MESDLYAVPLHHVFKGTNDQDSAHGSLRVSEHIIMRHLLNSTMQGKSGKSGKSVLGGIGF